MGNWKVEPTTEISCILRYLKPFSSYGHFFLIFSEKMPFFASEGVIFVDMRVLW